MRGDDRSKHLCVKVMLILELERHDLWKAFGLEAATTMRGHIPEPINATLTKDQYLNTNTWADAATEQPSADGIASLTARGSGCAIASMYFHKQAYDGDYISRSKESEALEGREWAWEPGCTKGLTLSLMSSSAIAWEMPTPSFGDVALPNSSIRINDSEEERPKIIAENAISLANVLRHFSMSSSFNRRVRRCAWMVRSGRQ